MGLIKPNERDVVMARRVDNVLERARLKKFAQYAADPARYAAEVLHISWWSKQIEIAESVRDRRRTAVYSGHSTGKTHGIGGITQWHYDCFDPSITLTTAPSWPSIHDLLWGEIRGQRPADAPGRLMDMKLDGGAQHYAKGHNAESDAGFQGRHAARQLIVLDEAQGIPGYIWEASNAMMTAPDCKMLVSGNPTETSGPFYDLRDDAGWNVIHISCLEHPNVLAALEGKPAPFPRAVSLMWVEEMIRDHCERTAELDADAFEFPIGSGNYYQPDDIFRPRVLGLFPKQAANSVFGEAAIEAARKSDLLWSDEEGFELGGDIARYGNDLTVLYLRRGPVVLKRLAYAKQDLMATTGRIVQALTDIAGEYQVEAKMVGLSIDDSGLGGGVTDRLRELGYTVNAINNGERALRPEDYFNRGSELWFALANRAQKLRLNLSRLPDDVYRKVSAELRARRYKMQSDKTLRVESKEELRKRLGRSPDDADALVLSFAGSRAIGREVLKAVTRTAPSKFARMSEAGGRWTRGKGGN